MNCARSALQRGQGLGLTRTRMVLLVGAMSWMCSNFLSRQGLQKLWPQGVDSGCVSVAAQMPQLNCLSSFSCPVSCEGEGQRREVRRYNVHECACLFVHAGQVQQQLSYHGDLERG
jgi:hypothetical protein